MQAITTSRTKFASHFLNYLLAVFALMAIQVFTAEARADGQTSYPAFFTLSSQDAATQGICTGVFHSYATAENACDGGYPWQNVQGSATYNHRVQPPWVEDTKTSWHVLTQYCQLSPGPCNWSPYGLNNWFSITCPQNLGGYFEDTPGGKHESGYCLTDVLPNRDSGCPLCQLLLSNPIAVGSGNKYETVTDYHGGGPFPLVVSRAYNSLISGQSGENIGAGWSMNLAGHLSIAITDQLVECQEPNSPYQYYTCPVAGYQNDLGTPVEVTVWGANGGQTLFDYTNAVTNNGVILLPSSGALTPEATGSGQLFFVTLPTPLSGNGFEYLAVNGNIEYFDSTGKLLLEQRPGGLQQTYQYNSSGQLTSVTDPSGRQLILAYDSSGRIKTVTAPSGVITYGYDTHSNLTSVQYPDNTTVQYLYENTSFPNALTGLIDEKGVRYATWGYDSNGRANSSQHAGGVDSFSFTYTLAPDGLVSGVHVVEPSGLGRDLTFSTINFMSRLLNESAPCTQCGDKIQTYTYDGNGFVASAKDFDGNVTQYVHDAFGNETSRTEAYGTQDARTITTQWNYSINQPSLITEPGRTTAYTYDSLGHVLIKTVTDTATSVARTTNYNYNSLNLLHTVTDPLGHVTTYLYDNQGNLSSITNALNQVTQITQYDANGMPLTFVDPNGVVTTLTYDARQRLATRTVAGAQTQFGYDKVGNLTQVTLPTGSYLKYSYDGAHRLTGITDSVGDNITYTLDNLGNRSIENTYDPINTLQKTLSRTYNSLNQLTKITGGAGQLTQYAPDTQGNVLTITDPLNNVTTQSFDPLNRLVTVIDPAAQSGGTNGNTTYNMDPLDRVGDVTDPKGLDTHYVYDAFGDVTEQDSPDTGKTTYTYDLDGNRLTKMDARNVQAIYSYDVLNRLTAISYPDTTRNTTYTYDQCSDGIGHLCGMTDATGTTTYNYDARGNVTQKSVTLNGHVFTVGYQYDTADKLTGMTYPSGLQVNYTRDSAERVTTVTANSSPVVANITYEPFGPITGFNYGNGLAETRYYDQDYRLTKINVPGVLAWKFTDDADNNITVITDNLGNNSQSFGYDNLNRLNSASGAYGTQGYMYDLNGNRLALNGTGYTYINGSNRLLTVGSLSRQYDAMGNLTGDGSHSYNYDTTGRLTGFDSVGTAYLYNGLGQRAAKFPVDNTTNFVSFTSPLAGAYLKGSVNVTASGSDVFGISSVQFQLDGANLGSAMTTAPYTIPWNTTTKPDGSHSLTLVAIDGTGRTTTSSVSVTVDNTPPTMTAFTSPANGVFVGGTTTVSVNAADNIGVASVEFYLDGAPLGAGVVAQPVNPAPNNNSYSFSWDTTKATQGYHVLTAIVTDNAGNTVTNSGVSVSVLQPPQAPTLDPTYQTVPVGNNASFTWTATCTGNPCYYQLNGLNEGTATSATVTATRTKTFTVKACNSSPVNSGCSPSSNTATVTVSGGCTKCAPVNNSSATPTSGASTTAPSSTSQPKPSGTGGPGGFSSVDNEPEKYIGIEDATPRVADVLPKEIHAGSIVASVTGVSSLQNTMTDTGVK